MKPLTKSILIIYKSVNRILQKLKEDNIQAYSAQASFFIIISAIPFIMLLITLSKFILPIDEQYIIEAIRDILPSSTYSFASGIIDEIFGNSSIPVISVTALTLLWSASKGVRSINTGLHNVYKSQSHKNYFINTLHSIVFTLAFIILLIAVFAILLFGRQIADFLVSANSVGAAIVTIIVQLRSAIFAILLTIIFSLIYRISAHNKRPWYSHIPGAMFSALGWLSFSFFYSLYIEHFSKYSLIYGSLTALILLMLWLYMCMIILLLGAELNVWVLSQKRII